MGLPCRQVHYPTEDAFSCRSIMPFLAIWSLLLPGNPVQRTPATNLQTRMMEDLGIAILRAKKVEFCGSCPLHVGKMGSIYHFSRALPASIWGRCSLSLVFNSIWGAHTHTHTQKGV